MLSWWITTWKKEWAWYVDGLQVYVWKEPDRGGEAFLSKVRESVPGARVLTPPEDVKDLSEAHCQNLDVPELLTELRAEADRDWDEQVDGSSVEDRTSSKIGSGFSDANPQQDSRSLASLAPWVRHQLAL